MSNEIEKAVSESLENSGQFTAQERDAISQAIVAGISALRSTLFGKAKNLLKYQGKHLKSNLLNSIFLFRGKWADLGSSFH